MLFNMQGIAYFFVIVAVTGGAYSLRSEPVKESNDLHHKTKEPSPYLVDLGKVGYKAFHVQRWTGNWTESKAFCESSGMRLASIQTVEERDFLSQQYEYAVFWGWHWTAARDSHTQRQLLWHYTNEDISIPLLMPEIPPTSDGLANDTFLTCGTYYIDEDFKGMMFHDCSRENGHVLCESDERS